MDAGPRVISPCASDPYYKEFLKDIQREDEAAKKGPAITATTTIVEETTETEPIITPLMSYVINRYKSSSGRARNGKGSSGDGREKENRKRMPAIPEKAAPSKSTPGDAATAGKAAPSKRGRGSKREDKSVKGKGTPAEAASASEKHQESSQTGVLRMKSICITLIFRTLPDTFCTNLARTV